MSNHTMDFGILEPDKRVGSLSLRNISLSYGQVQALRGFGADFHPGTLSVLVGGDGAGKTTLLATLANPDGRRRLGVHGFTPGQVGYQSATSGVWPNLSVAENLDLVAHSFGLRGAQWSTRRDDLLQAAGLTEFTGRIGTHLSGGMRQKLGAIMAMLPRPDLLLLDEPTTGVDPDSRANLWRLIKNSRSEGAIVIVASTYLNEAEMADQVLLLDNGNLLAAGSPAEVCAAMPGRIYARPVASGEVPDKDPHVWQRGTQIYHWTDSEELTQEDDGTVLEPQQIDLELATIGTLLAQRNFASVKRGETFSACREGRERGSTGGYGVKMDPGRSALIESTDLRLKFGSFRALDGVSLSVQSGEIVGLIGGNGAGKSTLIRVILGLLTPDSGQVLLLGAKPGHLGRVQVGYVPQSLGLYGSLSGAENLRFTRAIFGAKMGVQADVAAIGIPEVTLDSKKLIRDLPLGARRNCAVACALSHEPRLLIFDEPTSGMDALSRASLWKTLRRAAARGVGILITTHYQEEARQCDRVLHLERGRLVEH